VRNAAILSRPAPVYFTVPEVARRFAVSKATVRRWYADGRLTAVKINLRNVRITADSVGRLDRDLLRSATVNPEAVENVRLRREAHGLPPVPAAAMETPTRQTSAEEIADEPDGIIA